MGYALYTGIGKNTLRSLIKNNKLPALLIGRKNVIRIAVLEEFLALN
ncbi:helix-turn-helix domain-containing protein [Lachnospiraceae bacterium LCP25S3_G4]